MDFIYILMYKRTYGNSQKTSKFCHQLKHIQYNFPFFSNAENISNQLRKLTL